MPGRRHRRVEQTRPSPFRGQVRYRPAARSASAMPSRCHISSSTNAPPKRRESTISTSDASEEPVAAGSRIRLIDETSQRLLVDLVLASEVVDHLRHRHAGHRVPLAVGELQIGDLRAVLVPTAGLSQVHTYFISHKSRSINISCAYTIQTLRSSRTLRPGAMLTRTPENAYELRNSGLNRGSQDLHTSYTCT